MLSQQTARLGQCHDHLESNPALLELEKHVTAHTLRHTAATWLRQQTGDARLVAAYLGHSDFSTVSRYAHVAPDELHQAAEAITRGGGLNAIWAAHEGPKMSAATTLTRSH